MSLPHKRALGQVHPLNDLNPNALFLSNSQKERERERERECLFTLHGIMGNVSVPLF
jgi:hypothetical protein